MHERAAAAELDAATRSFVTVAFIDLCGSTKLANRLDPDHLAALLGQVRDAAAAIVRDHGGLVSQVYGDGMLAVFRGPGSGEQALAATLAVHGHVRSMPDVAAEPLRMHSGVHSGLVLLRPGDAERGRLETIGRATGIAARLSAAAGPDEVLVSRSTLGPLDGRFRVGTERMIAVSEAGDRVAAVPVLGAAAPGVPGHGAGGRRTPFLGRSAVIGEIEARLLAAEDRGPVCVAVTGPSGQGKSRLSEEFELRAAAAEAAVLRGAAVQGEQASTLQPFREVDAAAARMLGEEPHPAGGDLSGLAEAVADRLRRLAERRRVLLILDDWQWADSASLQLLGRLRAGGTALGILLLSREAAPGELPIVTDHLIDLQPVDEPASTALVERLRPELDMLDRLRVGRLAGGNPLYLEELCHLSVRALHGLLSADPGNDEIGRVAAIIEARVRALPADLAETLHSAAVVGGECGEWILEMLCGVSPGSPMLERLRELDLLIPSLTPGNVRFKHGVTRNVVYQLLPVEQRRALHRKVAELIERRDLGPGADRDELLAWHLYESGDFARALVHAEAAGDRAVAAASIDRAQLQYGRALKAIEQLPADQFYPDRVRLVGKYGYACVYDSDCVQLAVFDRAAAVAAARGDAGGEAVARFWHGYVCHGSGQAQRAVAELRSAIALSDAAPDSPFGVQLRATLGQALAAAGQHAAAAPHLDQAIDVKRAHRSGRNVSVGMAYSLALKAGVLGDTGHFSEARAAIDEALELLAGHSHPVEGSVMGWSAAVRYWQGDWQGLLETAERGCDVALRIETVYIHAISRAFAGYARWRLSGDEAAAEELVQAVACMVDRGKELALSIAYGCLADMEASRGNEAAARAAVEHAYRRAREGEPFGMAVAARAWARLIAPHDPDRARRMLLHARGNAHRRNSPHELARCDLEEAALRLVPPAVAVARLSQAEAAFERMGMSEDAERARSLIKAAGSSPYRAVQA
jgi:class 3 adenylate cyclase/tetratricopeptide (TPR) repeat protein